MYTLPKLGISLWKISSLSFEQQFLVLRKISGFHDFFWANIFVFVNYFFKHFCSKNKYLKQISKYKFKKRRDCHFGMVTSFSKRVKLNVKDLLMTQNKQKIIWEKISKSTPLLSFHCRNYFQTKKTFFIKKYCEKKCKSHRSPIERKLMPGKLPVMLSSS